MTLRSTHLSVRDGGIALGGRLVADAEFVIGHAVVRRSLRRGRRRAVAEGAVGAFAQFVTGPFDCMQQDERHHTANHACMSHQKTL